MKNIPKITVDEVRLYLEEKKYDFDPIRMWKRFKIPIIPMCDSEWIIAVGFINNRGLLKEFYHFLKYDKQS